MKTKTVNQIKPAYTHYLENEIKKVRQAAAIGDKEHLVSVIKTIVKPAASTYVNAKGKRLPTKKAKFLKIIASPKMTTEKVLFYCECSVNKANRTVAKYNNLPTE